MSEYLRAVDAFGKAEGDFCAFRNSRGESISYGRLKAYSDSLASWLLERAEPGKPIVVYGHKSPYMLVCFLACAKSGHAYVPVDIAYPASRIQDIVEQLDKPLLLNTTEEALEPLQPYLSGQLRAPDLEAYAQEGRTLPAQAQPLSGDDTFYVLFTSGSTGKPKGVEVTAECIDNFWEWMVAEFGREEKQVFFDRAPFSFDLSVTDLALGLGHGDTLFALEHEDEADLAKTFAALAGSGTTFWVSTASFADMCLRDPAFSRELLPRVHTFFFVGETLKNETAGRLFERFPGCTVVNGYGPTESTDLVTSVAITQEMVEAGEPLPVGRPRPGTVLKVLDPATLEELPAGTPGELYILGDTVAKGYFGRPDLTDAAFRSCPGHIAGGLRSYKTGDEVVVDKDGMLHFRGRMDFQIKLHGYRIELGDIESNLRLLEGVVDACVLPVERNGAISHLAAYVVLAEGAGTGDFAYTQSLKAGLKESVPAYMVPRKFVYVEGFPLNVNGKVDRARLRSMGG